jgi:hypothetical protein
MISPATLADWFQALSLVGLLGALALAMHAVLGFEVDPVDDSDDMKGDARRNAA